MSYTELGYQFLHYFVDCININYQNLLQTIKPHTMLSINEHEMIGPQQILNAFNWIQFSSLKIDPKFVLIQPIFNKSLNEYAGIVILASGTINLLENGIYVNKNSHINFVLDNINGAYYLNNLLIRLSEKSRQITQPGYYNYFQNYNQNYPTPMQY